MGEALDRERTQLGIRFTPGTRQVDHFDRDALGTRISFFSPLALFLLSFPLPLVLVLPSYLASLVYLSLANITNVLHLICICVRSIHTPITLSVSRASIPDHA